MKRPSIPLTAQPLDRLTLDENRSPRTVDVNRMARASQMVREESMTVNAEFAAIEKAAE